MHNTKDLTMIAIETLNIIVNRDQLIKNLIHVKPPDNLHETISLYLMEFIKMAMECSEKVSKDREVIRTLVIDAISNIIDKFVKNDTAKLTLKHVILQTSHSIVDISKEKMLD